MSQLTKTFKDIVGDGNVLTRELDTAYYRSGFRYGFGGALAVVFPTTLVEQWKVLQAAVEAGCAIIMQATKTGLTGGSSPSGFDYDRDLVIINVGITASSVNVIIPMFLVLTPLLLLLLATAL